MVALAMALADSSLITRDEGVVSGVISSSFRADYDLLVRPAAKGDALEDEHGLVRANFLSSSFGGISAAELAAVRRLPGVSVAAPLENIGYVLLQTTIRVPLAPEGGGNDRLYALTARVNTPGGEAPAFGTAYAYVTSARLRPLASGGVGASVDYGGRPVAVCGGTSGLTAELAAEAPSTLSGQDTGLYCFSRSDPSADTLSESDGELPVQVYIPVLLSAVDPAAEARLSGLRRAVVNGRYLDSADRPEKVSGTALGSIVRIPVLASDLNQVRASLSFSLQRLRPPPGGSVLGAITAPDARARLERFSELPVRRMAFRARFLYRAALEELVTSGRSSPGDPVPTYWTTSPARYRYISGWSVMALSTSNPLSIWDAPAGWGVAMISGNQAVMEAPPGSRDVQYVRLRERLLRPGAPVPALEEVGTFDPRRLFGYTLSRRAPLESYLPPSAPIVGTSRVDGPTWNLGGYLTQPPSLLTSMAGARAFFSEGFYAGEDVRTPISSIRVRVTGRVSDSPRWRERLAAVATEIERATHLRVDVLDGSSRTRVRVALEKSRLAGRPVVLDEDWFLRGASYSLATVADEKYLFLLAVLVALGTFSLFAVLYAAARARGGEQSILSALGWSRSQLWRRSLSEVLAGATLCGAAGVALGEAVCRLTGIPGWRLSWLPAAGGAVVLGLLAVSLGLLSTLSHPLLEESEGPLERRRPFGALGPLRVGAALLFGRPSSLCLVGLVLGAGEALQAELSRADAVFGHRLVATRTVLGRSVDLASSRADPLIAGVILAVAVTGAVAVCNIGRRRLSHAAGVLQALGWERGRVAAVAACYGALFGLAGFLVALLASLLAARLLPLGGVSFLGVGVTGLGVTAGLAALTAYWADADARDGSLATRLAEAQLR